MEKLVWEKIYTVWGKYALLVYHPTLKEGDFSAYFLSSIVTQKVGMGLLQKQMHLINTASKL